MWVEKHGKTYRIRDRIAGKPKTIQSGYPNKTSAKEAMKLYAADALRGDLVLPADGRITLNTWAEGWWEDRQGGLAPNTRRSEGSRLRGLILERIGAAELGALRPMHIQRWVRDLERAGYAAKTIHNAHGLLHSVLAAAVANRLIKANPCEGTKLTKGDAREMRFLTRAEAERLIAALPAHYRALVVVALGTGLRWAELAGLRVGRVDLVARTISVVETLNELTDGSLVWGPPKTKHSKRTIRIPHEVVEALRPLLAGKTPRALVFVTPRGAEMRPRNFRRVWLAALDRAGLEPPRAKGVRRTEGVRFHDVRHTHVSWLIAAGRHLTAISRRLGHASITITSDRYGHLLPDVDDGIVDALDDVMPSADLGEQEGSNGPGEARSDPEQPGETGWSEGLRAA